MTMTMILLNRLIYLAGRILLARDAGLNAAHVEREYAAVSAELANHLEGMR